MPDFTKLKPKKTGVLASGLFDISPRDTNDNFGFSFTGEIECPKDGKILLHYLFRRWLAVIDRWLARGSITMAFTVFRGVPVP